MYMIGYAIVSMALFAMGQMTATTPGWLYMLITSLAGLGTGSIGTITTLVAQFAVPKRLLGVAVGAIFFFQMIGLVVAPSILGLVQSNAPNLESGLKTVFLIGGVAMTIAFLMILTIPEISMRSEAPQARLPSLPDGSVEPSIV